MNRCAPPDNDRDKLLGNDGANYNLSKKPVLLHRCHEKPRSLANRPRIKRLPRYARNYQGRVSVKIALCQEMTI
ncbi:hypothetical protein [Marivirga lumbricoides]|uniref:hypothetical protein n=1 Tax=Marivirga lumbricoides TaxID=1046115 RepID=UPI001669EE93